MRELERPRALELLELRMHTKAGKRRQLDKLGSWAQLCAEWQLV